jgi:hypothetical protein
MKISDYKCDVCGKPATHAVRGCIEEPNDGTGFRSFKGGEPRIRCDEHKSESKMIQHPDPLCELRAKMMSHCSD